MSMEWVANVSKLPIGHDSFNVTAEVSRITVGYTKSYSPSDNTFTVSSVKIAMPAEGISIKSISNNPKDAEKTKI